MKLKLFITLFILLASHNLWAKRTVCSITINSRDEIEAFGKNLLKENFDAEKFQQNGVLNSEHYDFVELTKLGDEESWFEKSCSSGYRCDVLIISGHFAGYFFGTSGLTLTTDELEKKSCNNSCDNILKSPQEVFLFGCNTLDSGDNSRDRGAYREALSHYDMTDQEIEETLAFIYDGIGDKFQKRMQRIFNKAANIHGFGDKAPLGNRIKPYLEKVFKDIPDYKERLESIEARALTQNFQKELGLIEEIEIYNKSKDPMWLLNEISPSYKNCSGININSEDGKKRKKLCDLFTATSLNQQTLLMREMLQEQDSELFASYLPTIMSFLRDHELDYLTDTYEHTYLKEELGQLTPNIKNEYVLRSLNHIYEKMSASVSVQANILNTKKILGFIDQAAFDREGKKLVLKLLQKSLAQNKSNLCHLYRDYKIRPQITIADIGAGVNLKDPAEVKALQCLNIQDPQITAQVVANLNNVKDSDKLDVLKTIAKLPDYEPEIVDYALNNRHGSYKTEADKVLYIKSSQEKIQQEGLIGLIQDHKWPELYSLIKDGSHSNNNLSKTILDLKTDNKNSIIQKNNQIKIAYKLANKKDAEHMSYLYQSLENTINQGSFPELLLQDHIEDKNYTKEFKDYLVRFIINRSSDDYNYKLLYALRQVHLTKDDALKLIEKSKKLNPEFLPIMALREALKNQIHLSDNLEVRNFINSGPKASIACITFYEKNRKHFTCEDPKPYVYR